MLHCVPFTLIQALFTAIYNCLIETVIKTNVPPALEDPVVRKRDAFVQKLAHYIVITAMIVA